MKIALLGYGKMGKAIEEIALSRSHQIGVTIDNEDEWTTKLNDLKGCNMAIDFSFPSTAVNNMTRCFDLGLPVVVGTTGWYDQLDRMTDLCKAKNASLFVASNFSIGMNIMFALNRQMAQLMNRYPGYSVSIAETHHIHKLDAPSGTAITLANDIADRMQRCQGWQLVCDPQGNRPEPIDAQAVPITSYREGEVPGTHVVTYDSPEDTLTISHSAKSRKGLALGAVLAAEYLEGKKGYHTMQDLLA